ncbi:MAG: XdhC family protein [Woeseiaceae bacterium]|nr:XdhC family protein [Woeseiaceae bacterium]
MSYRDLRQFFEARRDDPGGLVLASVYDTLGSTYSKTGDRMLIASDGDFQGMLSGGCLEGDLAERAQRVLDRSQPESVTYDLRRNDEELWGLGVGCEGLMRIFLQPLHRDHGFEPFPAMIGVLEGDEPGVLVTVIDGPQASAPPGACVVGTAQRLTSIGVSGGSQDALHAAARDTLDADRSQYLTLKSGDQSVELLCAMLRPPPRVLILGGGLDAQPLLRALFDLGWRVTVQDHRPAYIDKGDFSLAERVLCEPAASLLQVLDLDRYAGVVVMSHHLDTDRSYLQQLAKTKVAYIGLLGPPDRRRRLVDELGPDAGQLEGRLHGPAGLPLGGRGPASIALSIAAELHRELMAGRGPA